jgi:hypothetical protein
VVEAIRDDLEARVRNLLARIGVDETPSAASPT